MSRKKKENAAQSTRQLMGIDGIKDYCIATRMGDLVFFIIKPTNISVLSDSSISARIYALLNVVKGQAEIEMLALNSKESFERNKNFYQERMGSEELPAIRRLLEQDSKIGSHPGADGIQPGVLYHHPAAKRKGNGCVPVSQPH